MSLLPNREIAPLSPQSSPQSGSSVSEDERYDEDYESPTKYVVEIEWPYEGERVFIACSYYGWTKYVPMARKHDGCTTTGLRFDDKQKTWVYSPASENPFCAVLKLPEGRHQYKFIVDGKWFYDMKKPNLHDPLGNINNYVDVTPGVHPFAKGDQAKNY